MTHDVDDAGKTQTNMYGERLGSVIDRADQRVVGVLFQQIVVQSLSIRLYQTLRLLMLLLLIMMMLR